MRRLGYLIVAVFLWGCASQGRDFGVTPVKNIQTNVTTQKDIFGAFGEPIEKGLENGYETWTYSYQYYEWVQLRNSKQLYVVFNKDGTVRSYSFTAK
jgi:hypothetical protein